MSPALTPGTVFEMSGRTHTITTITPKSIRYDTAIPGWEILQHHTTTPGAFSALVAAGLITFVERSTHMKVGTRVRTPDTHNGVVCDVTDDGFIWVMWGDNNRRRYTSNQVQAISA